MISTLEVENQNQEEDLHRSVFPLLFDRKNPSDVVKQPYFSLYKSLYKSRFGDFMSSPTRHSVF